MKTRKAFLMISVSILMMLFVGSSAWAISLPSPTFGAKYTDLTFSDFNYAGDSGFGLQNAGQHPGQDGTPSGNVWGIVSLTGVHSLTDNNPENNFLSGAATYNPGDDGKYYFGVFGGLTLTQADTGVGGTYEYLHLSEVSPGGSYLKIYETTDKTVYDTAAAAGANAGSLTPGAFGTFGAAITTGSTLWLDCTFDTQMLQYYYGHANAGDAEMIQLSSSTLGTAYAFLDVVGGTAAHTLDTNIFPYSFSLPLGLNADLKEISNNTANVDGFGHWNNTLWTSSSQDPITGGVVPEPTTLLLLGMGLLGLGYVGRNRRGSKSAN